MRNLQEAKIYVGTYRKYNEGSIYGKWLELCDYSDISDFYKACTKLHKDEKDPEFMFQDWEEIPEGLISESYLSDKTFEIINTLSEMKNTDSESFCSYLDLKSYDLSDMDIEEIKSNYEDDFCGEFDSEQAFADQEAYETYGNALDEGIGRYFDYESYCKDLFMEGYTFYEGCVFYDR